MPAPTRTIERNAKLATFEATFQNTRKSVWDDGEVLRARYLGSAEYTGRLIRSRPSTSVRHPWRIAGLVLCVSS